MVYVHSQLTSSQLHNPKGLQYAEDVLSFDSHDWHNSSLIWNEPLGMWKAKPSSGTGGTGTPGGADTQVQFNDGSSFGGDTAFTWIKGTNTLTIDGSISSQSISGSWTTPIYRGTGKPTAGAGFEGKIIRTSGSGTNKTYVWVCVRNSAGNYEWIQLGLSS